MKASEIYNPKTAFGNLNLLKVIMEEQLAIQKKENPCRRCDGKGQLLGMCEECDGTGKTMNTCSVCIGIGIESRN